jgi:halocin C8-like bacteriocin domain-containing protein
MYEKNSDSVTRRHAQIAFDIGCGSASAYLCGAAGFVSGGVALVGCATFLSILCNLPNTEESMKSACREAGAC